MDRLDWMTCPLLWNVLEDSNTITRGMLRQTTYVASQDAFKHMNNEQQMTDSNPDAPATLVEAVYDGTAAPQAAEGSFEIWTQEAWAWVINPTSIPKAKPPICYTHIEVFEDIAMAQGRPLSLEDVMVAVQPDGPLRICSRSKDEFQPVKYIPCLFAHLKQQLGMRRVYLRDCSIQFDGSFYCDTDNKPLAISGARYLWDGKNGVYRDDVDSKLVEQAKAAGKKFVEEALEKGTISKEDAQKMAHKKIWAKPYAFAMRHVLRKDSRSEADKFADRLLVVPAGLKALAFAQNEQKRLGNNV